MPYRQDHRQYPRYQQRVFHPGVFVWSSQGTGGAALPPPIGGHKRLYHNWIASAHWGRGIFVWQNAGSSGAAPVVVITTPIPSGVRKSKGIKRVIRLSDLPEEARQSTADFIKSHLKYQTEVSVLARKKYVAKQDKVSESERPEAAGTEADLIDMNNEILKLIILSSLQ